MVLPLACLDGKLDLEFIGRMVSQGEKQSWFLESITSYNTMFVKLFPDSYFSCKSFHAYDMHMSYLGMNELLYYDVIFRETSAISTGSASGGFDSKIWV